MPMRSRAASRVLKRLDLDDGEQPVAVFVPWQGSATFERLDAFCRGVVEGHVSVLATRPSAGAGRRRRRRRAGRHPLREEMKLDNAGRLDRRARAEGVRLHRHRRDAGGLGRRAGGDQVADLSGQQRGGAERVGPRVQFNPLNTLRHGRACRRPSRFMEHGPATRIEMGRDKPGHDVGKGSAKKR